MSDDLDTVTAAQARAKCYADRNPAAARRILGNGPPLYADYAPPTVKHTMATPLPRMPAQIEQPFWSASMRRSQCRQRKPRIEAPTLETSPARIVSAVCNVTHLSVGELTGKNRMYRIARPRQVACYLVAKYCPDLSLKQLGYIFHIHHTTAMHSLLAVPKRVARGHLSTISLLRRIEAVLRRPAQ